MVVVRGEKLRGDDHTVGGVCQWPDAPIVGIWANSFVIAPAVLKAASFVHVRMLITTRTSIDLKTLRRSTVVSCRFAAID